MGEMWRCPKCETVNNDDTCYVCGEKRVKQPPVVAPQPQPQPGPQPGPQLGPQPGPHPYPTGGAWDFDVPPPGYSAAGVKDPGSKTLMISIIVASVILALCVITGAVYFVISANAEEADAEEKANEAKKAKTVVVESVPEDVYYVNKFSTDGIFVRTGPGKEYSKLLHIEKGDQSVLLKDLNDPQVGSDGYTWHYVETPGGEPGYVREDVVVVKQ